MRFMICAVLCLVSGPSLAVGDGRAQPPPIDIPDGIDEETAKGWALHFDRTESEYRRLGGTVDTRTLKCWAAMSLEGTIRFGQSLILASKTSRAFPRATPLQPFPLKVLDATRKLIKELCDDKPGGPTGTFQRALRAYHWEARHIGQPKDIFRDMVARYRLARLGRDARVQAGVTDGLPPAITGLSERGAILAIAVGAAAFILPEGALAVDVAAGDAIAAQIVQAAAP